MICGVTKVGEDVKCAFVSVCESGRSLTSHLCNPDYKKVGVLCKMLIKNECLSTKGDILPFVRLDPCASPCASHWTPHLLTVTFIHKHKHTLTHTHTQHTCSLVHSVAITETRMKMMQTQITGTHIRRGTLQKFGCHNRGTDKSDSKHDANRHTARTYRPLYCCWSSEGSTQRGEAKLIIKHTVLTLTAQTHRVISASKQCNVSL